MRGNSLLDGGRGAHIDDEVLCPFANLGDVVTPNFCDGVENMARWSIFVALGETESDAFL